MTRRGPRTSGGRRLHRSFLAASPSSRAGWPPPEPRPGGRVDEPDPDASRKHASRDHAYWNHNVHYHPVVLDAVPDGCGEALDAGCGDGSLVRELAGRARRVTGVDQSPEMIRLARAGSRHVRNAAFVEADFLDVAQDRLQQGRYDFVSAVAVAHHMDFGAALTGMARLLAPGGRLAVIGPANDRTPMDRVISAAGVPASRLHARRHGGESWPPGMPVQSPAMSWGEIRRTARHLLPGCRFRRHLLWRYSLVWEKP